MNSTAKEKVILFLFTLTLFVFVNINLLTAQQDNAAEDADNHKTLGLLTSFIQKIQNNLVEIKEKNPGSAVDKLLVPVNKLEYQFAKEKNLYSAFKQYADEDEINALFERLELLANQLKKANRTYTYSKDLEVQFNTCTLFKNGHYALSDLGKKQMDLVVKDTQKSIKEYQKKFPHNEIVVALKVRGYADKKAFYQHQAEKERKRQNIEISYKRASEVGAYLSNALTESVDKVEEDIVGMGEELPPNVQETQIEDPKRRICTLAIMIYSKE